MSRVRTLESDLNFESLQREIQEAEDYLVRNSKDFSVKDNGKDQAPMRRSLEVSRKIEVLERIGRKPLSASLSVDSKPADSGRTVGNKPNMTINDTAPTPNKYMRAGEREKLLTRLLSEHHQGPAGSRGHNEHDAAPPGSSEIHDRTYAEESYRDDIPDSSIIEGEAGNETLYFASDLNIVPQGVADDDTSRHNANELEVLGNLEATAGPHYSYDDIEVPESDSLENVSERGVHRVRGRALGSTEDSGGHRDNGEKYGRIPVFRHNSPLDRTGRFVSTQQASSNTAVVSKAKLSEYAATAAERELSLRRQLERTRDNERKYLKSAIQVKQDAEAEFRKLHPFTPNISTSEQGPGGKVLSGRDINAHVVGGGRFLPVSRTGRPKQDALVKRIEHIRQMHEKSLKKREEDKLMLQRAEQQLCTFKPEISKESERLVSQRRLDQSSRSQSRSLSPYSRPSHDGGPSERLRGTVSGPVAASDRLYQEAWARKVEAIERYKAIKGINDGQNSFRPEINPNTENILKKAGSEYRPIYDRLGEIQRSRNTIREQRILEQENERKVDFTFTPEISDKSRKLAEKMLTTSESDVHAQGARPQSAPPSKNRSVLSAARGDGRGDQSGSSAESGCAASSNGNHSITSSDVSERLLARGREAQKRKHQLLKEREEEEARNMKRAVPTSRGTEIIASQNEGIRLTFLERQAYFDQLVKRHAAQRQAAEDSAATELFRPQLYSSTSAILSDARPEVLLQGPEERAKRLSELDRHKADARKKELESEIYNGNDYSFAPNIDKVSRALGRESSIDDLYENRRGQRVKMDLIRKAEDELAKTCTFHPKINPSSHHLEQSAPTEHERWESCPAAAEEDGERARWLGAGARGRHKPDNRSQSVVRINLREPERMAKEIRLHLAEKEQNRREVLAEREIEELKECTFHPRVQKHNPAAFRSPVVVRGIARHLELQSLSERKRREREEREKSAFKVKNIDKFKRTGDGKTIVESFSLSEPSHKMSRSVAELLDAEYSNMTFSPQTLDASKRSLARAYL